MASIAPAGIESFFGVGQRPEYVQPQSHLLVLKDDRDVAGALDLAAPQSHLLVLKGEDEGSILDLTVASIAPAGIER